jgi:hypothetical protein
MNSEWQAVLEPSTLRSLRFTPERLATPGFVAMVTRARNLGLVQHISLCIPLPEYGCASCEGPVAEEEWYAMYGAVWDGLEGTFGVLSTWERTGPLSLDISIQSPSDACHHFRHIDVDGQQQDTATAIHDPRHGWENGRHVALPPMDAVNRLWEHMEFTPEDWEELPQVTAVSSLSLRRQATRRWSATGVAELVKHLDGLENLHYEPWREWDAKDILEVDFSTLTSPTATPDCSRTNPYLPDSTPLLFGALPSAGSSLSRVILFEDFSQTYVKALPPPTTVSPFPWFDSQPIRRPSLSVTRDLVQASANLPGLEHLSASFFVDAQWFFPAVVSLATTGPDSWSKLTTLTLTSQWLHPGQRAEVVTGILEAAAAAATRFPALQTLEVWNGRKGLACLFQYQAPPPPSSSSSSDTGRRGKVVGGAKITWRATWDVEVDDRIICAWDKVVGKRDPYMQLEVVKEVLGAGVVADIKSHGDAIRHLGMATEVVHPVSLSQIQRENMYEVVEVEELE